MVEKDIDSGKKYRNSGKKIYRCEKKQIVQKKIVKKIDSGKSRDNGKKYTVKRKQRQ